MISKIILAFSIIGILIGIVVTGVSTALPMLTNGRTSWEEAALGIIAGLLVLFISFLTFVVGLVLVIKNRKKP